MKHIFWLPLTLPFFMWAMDYTPPNPLPAALQEQINKAAELASIDVRQEHKRHSREHTTVEIHGEIIDADGKKTQLEFKKDGTLSTSADSEEVKKTYTKRFVVTTNCVSVALTALVGAGVTLAIKFGECPK